MFYLLKTEPDAYSFADLEREKETVWDGVKNPQAVKHLAAMKPGEKLILYHTGSVRAAIGTAKVLSVDVTDTRAPLVRIRVGKLLPNPKALTEIKSEELFAASPLLKQGRLSVVPLTEEQYGWLIA